MPALQIYAPLHVVAPSAATVLSVSEIDVVDLGRNAPTPTAVAPAAGFTATSVRHTSLYTLVRYRAPTPTPLPFTTAVTLALVHVPGPAILAGG